MTCANEQIVTAFEECGLTPEQIATEQELEVTAVKAILMQFSAAYRKICRVEKEGDNYNFSDSQYRAATDVIANLAQYSEDERVQARCAMYVRDDRKGRLDQVNKMAGLNINVITFNEQMKKALQAVQRSKAAAIDVQSSVKTE